MTFQTNVWLLERTSNVFIPSQMTAQLDDQQHCISWSPVMVRQMVTPWWMSACVSFFFFLVQMAIPQMTSSSTGGEASLLWQGWHELSYLSFPLLITSWYPKMSSFPQVNVVLCCLIYELHPPWADRKADGRLCRILLISNQADYLINVCR